MPLNPWKTLSSARIYGNPWFSVREDTVIRPDGQPGTYTVVSAARLATGIVPLWPDETITLVGQYRYALEEYSWEIPEGGGPLDADPLDIARAELREETGIEAANWEYLARVHTSNCFTDEVGHVFLATGLTQHEAQPDPEEVLTARRIPVAEAIRMARDGAITDAITIAALFHLSLRRAVK
jgi:8-oxo-dGTP pyrophosphatase MutT (NUDIX family)